MQHIDNYLHRKNISSKRRRKFKNRRKSAKECWCHCTKEEHYLDKDHNVFIPKNRQEALYYKKSKDFTLCDIYNKGRQDNCARRYWSREEHDSIMSDNKEYVKQYKDEFIIKKKEVILKARPVEKEEKICSICCESFPSLKYINCKRKGLQNINFGKFSDCCKDKGICDNCISMCKHSCPFCKQHPLHPIKNKFGKKKKPFAIRMKNKNQTRENLTNNSIESNELFDNVMNWQPPAINDSISSIESDDSNFSFTVDDRFSALIDYFSYINQRILNFNNFNFETNYGIPPCSRCGSTNLRFTERHSHRSPEEIVTEAFCITCQHREIISN